jgi:hypothetical protein
MIHELVGIKDNTAILTSPKVAEQYRWAAVQPTFVVVLCCSLYGLCLLRSGDFRLVLASCRIDRPILT